MSYNITDFRLKSVSLVLPKRFSMIEFSGHAWAEIRVGGPGLGTDLDYWEYNENGEALSMKGRVTGQGLEVTDLDCWGVWSGHAYHEMLIPLFKKFKGSMEASIVWEGGDSITRLTIKDGEVTEEEIEI